MKFWKYNKRELRKIFLAYARICVCERERDRALRLEVVPEFTSDSYAGHRRPLTMMFDSLSYLGMLCSEYKDHIMSITRRAHQGVTTSIPFARKRSATRPATESEKENAKNDETRTKKPTWKNEEAEGVRQKCISDVQETLQPSSQKTKFRRNKRGSVWKSFFFFSHVEAVKDKNKAGEVQFWKVATVSFVLVASTVCRRR